MILFFLGETAASHPFFVVTLLSSIFKRRGGKGREGEALRDEKKNGCVAYYSCGRCIKREVAAYVFQLRQKKNKRRNKVAAFVGSITSSCSENEPALLPRTERKWLRSLSRPPETQTTTTPGKHFRRQIHS